MLNSLQIAQMLLRQTIYHTQGHMSFVNACVNRPRVATFCEVFEPHFLRMMTGQARSKWSFGRRCHALSPRHALVTLVGNIGRGSEPSSTKSKNCIEFCRFLASWDFIIEDFIFIFFATCGIDPCLIQGAQDSDEHGP